MLLLYFILPLQRYIYDLREVEMHDGSVLQVDLYVSGCTIRLRLTR